MGSWMTDKLTVRQLGWAVKVKKHVLANVTDVEVTFFDGRKLWTAESALTEKCLRAHISEEAAVGYQIARSFVEVAKTLEDAAHARRI